MKIGTFENYSVTDSAGPETIEGLETEELPLLEHLSDDSVDAAIRVIEHDDVEIDRLSHQVGLLSETYDELQSSSAISAAQARALSLQMRQLDPFLTPTMIATRESLMAAISEDGQKNLELTRESLGATLAVVAATLAVIGAILGALYYFLKNNDIGGSQNSHIDRTFNKGSKISPGGKGIAGGDISKVSGRRNESKDNIKATVSSDLKRNGVNPQRADKVADKIADRIIRIKSIYDEFGFFTSSHIASVDFRKAITNYRNHTSLGDISRKLGDEIEVAVKELRDTMSFDTKIVDEATSERMRKRLGVAVDSAVQSIRNLGREIKHNDARLVIEDIDKTRTYIGFPMFMNSSGPVISIGADNSVRVESVATNGSPEITSDIDASGFMAVKSSFKDIPKATEAAERESQKRANIGKQVSDLANDMRKSTTADGQRVSAAGMVTVLNSSRSVISALDSVWLKLCKSANRLTDIASTTFDITLAAQSAGGNASSKTNP